MDRPVGDSKILEGDIVVTAVPGGDYIISRMKADGTTRNIATQADRKAALRQACDHAGADHRVFFYSNPDSSDRRYVPIDCSASRANR
jgi:hypothetical protein